MIGLTFSVQNIEQVMQVYDQIQVIRYDAVTINSPDTPVGDIISLVGWVAVSGTVDYPVPISLVTGQDFYQSYDPIGEATDWFSSRYYDTLTGSYSAWSAPILGADGDLYYDPVYPPEIEYNTENKAIIKRIRTYIGDPLGLNREHGEAAQSNISPDGKTYKLDQKGWPVYITMGGHSFTDLANPSVNGYKYLKFQSVIDEICTGCAQIENICGEEEIRQYDQGVDIWYYTFRFSDRQIMETYDSCPPPPGLTSTTATSQAYMYQTAIDLINKELLEDAVEDGAAIRDEGSSYNPEGGLKIRKDLLDGLNKQLDDVVNSLMLKGITGVLVD